MMDNAAISYFVNILRSQNYINDLEKDIIDTWNELNKTPIDLDSAKAQEFHNRINYPDLQLNILAMSTTVIKEPNQVNKYDLVYGLNCQLALLLKKRFGQDWNIARQGRQKLFSLESTEASPGRAEVLPITIAKVDLI